MRHGSFTVRNGETAYRVDVQPDGTAQVKPAAHNGTDAKDHSPVPVGLESIARSKCRAWAGGRWRDVFVWVSGDQRHVFVDGEVFELEATAAGLRPRRARHRGDELSAPMPAKVREVLVSRGQAVRAGDVLVKLEAMKMELAIRAPRAGTVVSINCTVGELVAQGAQLLEITP
ncbi:MAG: biotin/lipoyl-binding protein [Acidobacteria bacterium]|nr:MAG: biotin/lipoyl-binding protein [Acidobacteriota bacterium]